jgi:hypothetical protein
LIRAGIDVPSPLLTLLSCSGQSVLGSSIAPIDEGWGAGEIGFVWQKRV